MNELLNATDLTKFLRLFNKVFQQFDNSDIIKAVQILIAYKKDFIKNNLKDNKLPKIIYNQIQNSIPRKIIDVIQDKYSFSSKENKILNYIYAKPFNFNDLIYNHEILKIIDNIILEEKKK